MGDGAPTGQCRDSGDSMPAGTLDLRGTPCPLNYVRCRLALERIAPGSCLQVRLDSGEPEQMVIEGLRSEGHAVKVLKPGGDPPHGSVHLSIRRGGQ